MVNITREFWLALNSSRLVKGALPERLGVRNVIVQYVGWCGSWHKGSRRLFQNGHEPQPRCLVTQQSQHSTGGMPCEVDKIGVGLYMAAIHQMLCAIPAETI